jgi:hypothetical protein
VRTRAKEVPTRRHVRGYEIRAETCQYVRTRAPRAEGQETRAGTCCIVSGFTEYVRQRADTCATCSTCQR